MTINEASIKNSFNKVKEEANSLKNELKTLELRVNRLISLLEKNPKNDVFFDISSGNKGVINNQQPSSTIINNDFRSFEVIKNEINEQFKDLSDREFSIFLAIYTLEEEFGKAITLRDLSTKLKVSEITIRGYINTLISKNIPIIKERPFNKKLQLSINKGFRDLALISRLISIRNNNNKQKTLFDV